MSFPYNGDTVGKNYSSYGMNRYLGLYTPGNYTISTNIWELDLPYRLSAIQSVSSKILVTEFGNVTGAGTGPYSGAFNGSIAYSRRANGYAYLPNGTPGNGYDEVGFNHLAYDGSLYWTIDAPHRSATNVLYCDGHVKAEGAGLSNLALVTSATGGNKWIPTSNTAGAVHASTWYPDVP
jgi:prepilin-type processing-associated H-X9-DG protein